MKEVEKKDVPEVSGGQSTVADPMPTNPLPYPGYPPNPAGPGDASDSFGDALRKNQVQS